MSLFQTREWWSTTISTEDEFDQGSMCTGNLGNHHHENKPMIVVGNMNGELRIYEPRGKDGQISDLVLEQDVGKPILQIEMGMFVANSTTLALAMLHPRDLTVYQLRVGGNVVSPLDADPSANEPETSKLYLLEQVYSHKLGENGSHFTAYNFTFGPFGGVASKDFIAVQSMDGQLQVFEQESYAFLRKLNHVLIPGPMTYVSRTDSFLVYNSKMFLDCYRYHVVAGADSSKGAVTGTTDDHGELTELLQTSWTCNIGEEIRAIVLARVSRTLTSSQGDVLLLGEHNLFYLRENGSLRSQRKFEAGLQPMCISTFKRGREEEQLEGIIVAFSNGILHVLDDQVLVWAARLHPLQSLPVALSVGSYAGLDGSILVLEENGHLGSYYLGTESVSWDITSKPNTIHSASNMSYAEVEQKHHEVLQQIKQLLGNDRGNVQQNKPVYKQDSTTLFDEDSRKSTKDDMLNIRIEVPDVRDTIPMEEQAILDSENHQFVSYLNGEVLQVTINIHVSYTGSEATSVSVALQLPPGFAADEQMDTIASLQGNKQRGTPLVIKRTIRVLNIGVNPPSLNFVVSAQGLNSAGNMRTCVREGRLPLFMVAIPKEYEKVPASFKLTIDSNLTPTPRMATLFDDMVRQNGIDSDVMQAISSCTSNSIQFRYANGEIASIIVSKTAARYRVQADSLDCIWLLLEELCMRLRQHFMSSNTPLEIKYQDVLPLADYFVIVDNHFSSRVDLAQSYSDLNDRSHQLRVVQRRLLARFQDKNARPLGGLSVLFHESYNQVMECSNRVITHQQQVDLNGMKLSAATSLLASLMAMRFELSREEQMVLESTLSNHVNDLDGEDTGWEESVTTAMNLVLKTVLAKKQPAGYVAPPEVNPMASTKKLKKSLTLVCDKLSRGGSLVGGHRQQNRELQPVERKED